MKNGFTLIELTSIVAILGIIFLISFPQFQSLYQKDSSKRYESLEKSLCEAGKEYIYANIDSYNLTSTSDDIEISIEDLSDNGYVDKMQVNPKTNKKIENGKLVFTVSSELVLTCEYVE